MRRASALLERLAAPPARTTQERYRHELKYLINEGEHAAIACRMAPVFKLDKHARAGGYTIRSLYFDDYCNSAYEEKDAGNHHHDHHCRDPYERIHAGTRRNACGNGPKQIQQVKRVLDRRTIADDGQSTDHTERDDHVRRDRERHHAGEHAHAHERHGKTARIHHAGKKALVHVIDQDAHGERHEQRQADLGRVDLTKRLQDGVLKKVPGAHGLNIPSVLKIRFPVVKAA